MQISFLWRLFDTYYPCQIHYGRRIIISSFDLLSLTKYFHREGLEAGEHDELDDVQIEHLRDELCLRFRHDVFGNVQVRKEVEIDSSLPEKARVDENVDLIPQKLI